METNKDGISSVFVHLDHKVIQLNFRDFDDEIDVDTLTSIDYSNLYGEAVTVSALLNKIGIFKAEAEHSFQEEKLKLDIYEANLRKDIRREAAENSGKILISEKPLEYLKLTENTLNELVLLDQGWQVLKKNVAKRQKDLAYVESLFWAIQDKSRKLNNLLPQIVPSDFENEIIEGKINGIFIKKHKKHF